MGALRLYQYRRNVRDRDYACQGKTTVFTVKTKDLGLKAKQLA